MAEDRSLTPEKQLLNIIEKPMSQGSLRTATIKYQSLSLFSLSAIKGRFAFLKSRFSEKVVCLRQLDIKALNIVLKFAVAILLLYFIVNLASSSMRLKKDFKFKIKAGKIEEVSSTQPITSPLKAEAYYLEKARERDIFSFGLKRQAVAEGTVSGGPSQELLEATQNLWLVVGSWSDDPDVMIEDTKTQRTFFLKNGQSIDNKIKIQAIFKEKVVLSYKGEEVELK